MRGEGNLLDLKCPNLNVSHMLKKKNFTASRLMFDATTVHTCLAELTHKISHYKGILF